MSAVKWHSVRPFYWMLFNFWVATFIALAAAWLICIWHGPRVSGLYDHHLSGTWSVRERNTVMLVQPEWISNAGHSIGSGSGFEPVFNWYAAEMRARSLVIFAVWIGACGLSIRYYMRRRRLRFPQLS